MLVIGFFENLTSRIGDLIYFVSTPLGELNDAIVIEPLKSMSIMGLFGTSLLTFLVVLLGFHAIRLFVGG